MSDQRGRILLVEDTPTQAEITRALLDELGHAVRHAETGAHGLAMALEWLPDAILVDLQLPDFDGFEVLRRLRAQPQTATTPCIALSANATAEDIARGLAAGFDDYWTKPIRFKPFLEALERRFPARAA